MLLGRKTTPNKQQAYIDIYDRYHIPLQLHTNIKQITLEIYKPAPLVFLTRPGARLSSRPREVNRGSREEITQVVNGSQTCFIWKTRKTHTAERRCFSTVRREAAQHGGPVSDWSRRSRSSAWCHTRRGLVLGGVELQHATAWGAAGYFVWGMVVVEVSE